MKLRGKIEFNHKKLHSLDELFYKYSKINPNKIPKRYEKAVLGSRECIFNNCKVEAVIQCVHIKERSNDSIVLESGHILSGSMLAEKLKDLSKIYLCVITVKNFTQAFKKFNGGDMMESFCFDTWGNVLMESAEMVLQEKIEEEMENEELTEKLCPGETGFSIDNQVPLFDILKPEDIGVELTDAYLMNPVKTVSYIMGVKSK